MRSAANRPANDRRTALEALLLIISGSTVKRRITKAEKGKKTKQADAQQEDEDGMADEVREGEDLCLVAC